MSEPLPPDFATALHVTSPRRGHLGCDVHYFSDTSSTNDVASAYAERGAAEGTVVVAGAQSSGRGRFGRVWHSPPGAGLYMSIVFRDLRAAPFLTLAGGVAVVDGVGAATGLPLEIKWPNDVIAAGSNGPAQRRKIAGVLAEGRRPLTPFSMSSLESASTSVPQHIRMTSPFGPRRSRPSSDVRLTPARFSPRCWRRSPAC